MYRATGSVTVLLLVEISPAIQRIQHQKKDSNYGNLLKLVIHKAGNVKNLLIN